MIAIQVLREELNVALSLSAGSDILRMSDAARATVALAETESAAGEIVNVGGEREIRIRALGEMMMKLCGFEGESRNNRR